jgi:hypothetical protein
MKKNFWALGFLICGVICIGLWSSLERTTRPAPIATTINPNNPTGSVVSVPTTVEAAGPGFTIESDAASGEPPPDAELPGAAVPVADPARGGLPTVSDVLAEPGDDYVKIAQKLSALVRSDLLPLTEREEALAHTLNLSAGNEVVVLTPLVSDGKLPESLTDTILAEALNRSLSYQADLYLVALGRTPPPSPDLKSRIREHLKFLTNGEDRGDNPQSWLADIKTAKETWAQ